MARKTIAMSLTAQNYDLNNPGNVSENSQLTITYRLNGSTCKDIINAEEISNAIKDYNAGVGPAARLLAYVGDAMINIAILYDRMASTRETKAINTLIAVSETESETWLEATRAQSAEQVAEPVSHKAVKLAQEALNTALSDARSDSSHVDVKTAIRNAIEQAGYNMVSLALAYEVADRGAIDGRFSRANVEWAKGIAASNPVTRPESLCYGYLANHHHTTIVDALVSAFRSYEPEQAQEPVAQTVDNAEPVAQTAQTAETTQESAINAPQSTLVWAPYRRGVLRIALQRVVGTSIDPQCVQYRDNDGVRSAIYETDNATYVARRIGHDDRGIRVMITMTPVKLACVATQSITDTAVDAVAETYNADRSAVADSIIAEAGETVWFAGGDSTEIAATMVAYDVTDPATLVQIREYAI